VWFRNGAAGKLRFLAGLDRVFVESSTTKAANISAEVGLSDLTAGTFAHSLPYGRKQRARDCDALALSPDMFCFWIEPIGGMGREDVERISQLIPPLLLKTALC